MSLQDVQVLMFQIQQRMIIFRRKIKNKQL